MEDIVPKFTLIRTDFWATTVTLGSWRGFQSRRGGYGSADRTDPSDGEVQIIFAPEGRGIEPLSTSEIAIVTWVIKNEADISKALLSALAKEYPKLQEAYGFSGAQRATFMPDIRSVDDLRPLIGLTAVNVHQVQKVGIPYVGFELGCTWDQENGLGILMHGTRAVQIGGADKAILLWVATEDGGLPLPE